MRRSLLTVAPLVVAAFGALFLVLTPEKTPANTDRSFVAAMIPHHRLGMRLLDDAATNSSDVRLRRLAFEMNSYHTAEVQTLDQWSRNWNVNQATEFAGDLSQQELRSLASAVGIDHDTLWLSLMIHHHRGALDITKIGMSGSFDSVKTLATQISLAQSKQIDEMSALLNDLCNEKTDGLGCSR